MGHFPCVLGCVHSLLGLFVIAPYSLVLPGVIAAWVTRILNHSATSGHNDKQQGWAGQKQNKVRRLGQYTQNWSLYFLWFLKYRIPKRAMLYAENSRQHVQSRQRQTGFTAFKWVDFNQSSSYRHLQVTRMHFIYIRLWEKCSLLLLTVLGMLGKIHTSLIGPIIS